MNRFVTLAFLFGTGIATALVITLILKSPSSKVSSGQPGQDTRTSTTKPLDSSNLTVPVSGYVEVTLPENLREKWRIKLNKGYLRGSVVLSGSFLYAADESGTLHAISATSGTIIWSTKVSEDGFVGTPSAQGNLLWCATSEGLACIDLSTQSKIWSATIPSMVPGGLGLAAKANGDLVAIIGAKDGQIRGYDAKTGNELWAYETGDTQYGVNGDIRISHGHALAAGCDSTLHVVDIETGKALQQVPLGSPCGGSVGADWPLAIVGTHEAGICAIDMSQGKTLWDGMGDGKDLFATAAIANDLVVMSGRGGTIFGLNRSNGKELWQLPAEGEVQGCILIARDKILVGDLAGTLQLLTRSEGKLLSSYSVGSSILAAPVIGPDAFYITGSGGTIVAFQR
jgi:outer membrane protein assembly factor BamB